MDKLPVKKKCANDFKFIGLIGEGSFSMVALAVDIHNKQKYAIKICEKRQLLKENKAKAIMREKEILNLLDSHSSPYFIRLHFSFQDSYRLFFGLSFAKGGELLTYINKLSGFNEECTRFYSAQILLALEYLHKLGIIHRDLKPENLLLNERLHIQITDFGSAFKGSPESIKPYDCDSIQRKRITSSESRDLIKNGESKNGDSQDGTVDEVDGEEVTDDENRVDNNSKETEDEENSNSNDYPSKQRLRRRLEFNSNDDNRRNSRSNSFVGTAQYVSPEMLKYKRSFTSSDLWAYGCIVYQMLAGNPPFNDATDFLIFQKILAVNVIYPEDKIDFEAKDLINKFLDLDPCSRLGASDDFTLGYYSSIRSHPFFSELSQPAKVTVTATTTTTTITTSSTATTTTTTSTSSSLSTSITSSITSPPPPPPPPSSNLPRSGFPNQASSHPPTRWSTLHLERSPLLDFFNKEDYNLESRISCLNYDEIEPGLHEGLLLGLGLSDNPKRSDLPLDKRDSTKSSSSSAVPSTQKPGYNTYNLTSSSSTITTNTTSNRSGDNFNTSIDKNNSSHKENSRSNNNPERVKKKGLLAKLFKH